MESGAQEEAVSALGSLMTEGPTPRAEPRGLGHRFTDAAWQGERLFESSASKLCKYSLHSEADVCWNMDSYEANVRSSNTDGVPGSPSVARL